MNDIKNYDDWLNEGHSYDQELENARMMRSSADELTQWAMRKIEESKPENYKANEELTLPLYDGLYFNDDMGVPTKISKEIVAIAAKALPPKLIKAIQEVEPNGLNQMASPHPATKKGVGTGETEYKTVGLIFEKPYYGKKKLKYLTIGIRKRTSGPGTGYLAISGSVDKNGMSHTLELGQYNPGRYSVATEFYDNPSEKLKELFDREVAPKI